MPRSASTLQYQIAVEVVRAANLGDAAGWDWPSVCVEDALPGTPMRVVKVHDPSPEFESRLPPEGVIYLYSYRDIRDAAASFMAKFGNRDPKALAGVVRAFVRHHEYFTSRPGAAVSRYEEFTRDVPAEVRRIASVLRAPLNESQVHSIANALTPDRQRARISEFAEASPEPWDSTTLLHRDHLGDGAIGKWRTTLSQAHLDAVLRVAGQWLRDHGYESETLESQGAA